MLPKLRYDLFVLVYSELNKWQNGVYSVDELFEILQRKITFFVNGQKRKELEITL